MYFWMFIYEGKDETERALGIGSSVIVQATTKEWAETCAFLDSGRADYAEVFCIS